ncbi:putative c6 transcription protein [Neofusicoccum parvum UCRNP2]|uniref:Putative c6 transcription protein n=1 Tax=Botryosphaeria parva (strain UCR-NP2) TaxID=1287680 RepID=R1ELZ3_BOTPV|nr:putative c6 transcription protein [Neofusicoccum parvum UCRNP2]
MAAVSPLSASSSTTPQQQHPEKRRKITRACDACKAKKKRCTGTQPCPSCEKAAKPCQYLASYTRGRFTTPPSSRGLDALILAAESHDVNFGADRERRPSSARASDANAPSPQLSRGPQSPEIAVQRHHSLSSAYGVPVQSPTQVFTQPQPPSYLPPLPTFQQPHPNASYQWRPPAVQDPTSKEPSRRPSPEPDGNFDGHYLGPSSSVAWLRRALRKLGQQRALKEKLLDGANHESPKDVTIFNYGDKDAPTASGSGLSLPAAKRTDYLLTRYFEFAAPTYRFLHRPTLESWLAAMHDPNSSLIPAKKAVVLVILAIATLYELSQIKDPELNIRRESEMYYREAQALISKETGPATLESVQARFALVHYLLSTARSNQAWFTFGTTVQLAMALGLHRRRSLGDKNESLINRECQRRLFWSMYTTDRYGYHSAPSNPATRESVDECLAAARTAIEMVLNYITEGQPFSSFWFTQYVAFNALAITYLYLLQSRRQGIDILYQHRDLLTLADTCQQYLADVTEANAPSMRYSIILEELREELSRQVSSSSADHPAADSLHPPPTENGNGAAAALSPRALPSDSAILLDGGAGGEVAQQHQQVDGDGSSVGDLQQLDWDLDFWPQLDSLPMCRFFPACCF